MELTHVRLLVDTFDECFRFYRDVLGLETGFRGEPPYAEFRLGGDKFLALFDRTLMAGAVGTVELPGDVAARDRLALILRVDGVDAEAKRLAEEGVAIAVAPADRPEWGLRTVHVRDPDGNLVELYEPLEKPEAQP